MNTGDTLKVLNKYNAVCTNDLVNNTNIQIPTDFLYFCTKSETYNSTCNNPITNQLSFTFNSFSLLQHTLTIKVPTDTCVQIQREFTFKFFNNGNEISYLPRFMFTNFHRNFNGLIDTSSIQIILPDSSKFFYRNIKVDNAINFCQSIVPAPAKVGLEVNISPDSSTYSNFILDRLFPNDTVIVKFTVTRCCIEENEFENRYYSNYSNSLIQIITPYGDYGYGIWAAYDPNMCGNNSCKPLSQGAYHFPNNAPSNICNISNYPYESINNGRVSFIQVDNKVRTYIMGRGFETDTFTVGNTDYRNSLNFVKRRDFIIKVKVLTEPGLRYMPIQLS
jgi:hypothetical protein